MNTINLPLYLYVTEESLINILKEGKLNVSRPWATNDITEAVKQGEEKQREQIKEYGYICLSGTCISPAMWGYYADRSRGACLVFSFPLLTSDDKSFKVKKTRTTKSDPDIVIKKVEYGKERLNSEDIDELLFRKSLDWQHENEYRIKVNLSQLDCIESKGKDGDLNISFKSNLITKYLTAIILGVNCNKQKPEIDGLIRNISRDKKIQVIKAKMSTSNFEFDIDSNIFSLPDFYYRDDDED